jgi:ABC-type hemin transport system ATPase subunit
MSQSSRASHKEKPGKGRIAFPDQLFVAVPIEAIESGLVRELNGGEIKRLLALLRVANHQCKEVGQRFQVRDEDLRRLDGASQRTAYRATRGLQARGVIWFTSDTKPFTYILNLPSEWRDRKGRPLAMAKPNLAPAWPKA